MLCCAVLLSIADRGCHSWVFDVHAFGRAIVSDLVAESLMFNVLGGMLCFLFGCSGLANVDVLRVTDSPVYIT